MVSRRVMRQAVFTLAVATVVAVVALPVAAFTVKEVRDSLDLAVYVNPELRVPETITDAESIRDQVPAIEQMDAFKAEHGAAWRFLVDQRRGVPTLVEGGAIPFLPGAANQLSWASFAPGCSAADCVPVARVAEQALDILKRYREIFEVNPDELVLDPNGSGPVGASIYFLRFQWTPDGVPVERGSIFFRLNGGNLIQIASEGIGRLRLDTKPTLTPQDAWLALDGHLGPYASPTDEVLDKGSLLIVPVTPTGMNPESFSGSFGTGVTYRLGWRVAFVRPGVTGRWEAVVDAHNGELLRFVDANRYGRVHGGAYPSENHTGAADRPFPFADTGLAAPNNYSDAGGLFPGNNATTTLVGKYTWIDDGCGAISNTTTTGDVDFGAPTTGTNCDVPSPNYGGPGNTHSARTLYWHATNVNIKARTYMPTNDWLNNNHINVNTNGSPWCNATSGGGSINFYQSSSGCWNLGEIPGVALHEWGHSMDDFDGSGGDSPPVETRADWTASLQTHDSCTGRGFYYPTGDCDGYGDACLDCSGIRDSNWDMHENHTPWTVVNGGSGGIYNCGGGGSYNGPCGWEDHCESGISTQALYDFVYRDLIAQGLDLTTAWMLEDRLFYGAMPTMGNMYSCTPPTSNGCNGGGLYATMKALDDDGDGTANGTPHAASIFAALNRHMIACGAAGDATNQNQTSCPTLTVTTLNADAGNNSAVLTWPAVTNATRYKVYRNEIGCDAGFTKVGEVTAPTLTFTDTTVVNGIEYYYRFQALTASDSCTSAMSNCATVIPQPCAGSVVLDRSTYSCADVISIQMTDSDLGGTGTANVTVWSGNEPTPETVILTETPAGSSIFVGTIATSTSTTHGDGAIGVANGATVTVRYVDVDYCGVPNVNVETTAAADCVGPIISSVTVDNVTGMSADVSWTTSEVANSLVTYDTVTPPVAGTASDPAYVTSHLMPLTGLAECTDYYFFVTSVDPASNSATDNNGGAYYTFSTGKNTMPSYPSTDTPLPITDYTTTNSVIAVADDKPVVDVNVLVNITHTYDGDIQLSLIGPNGTEVTLSANHGSSGENYTNTVFDDEATTPIGSGTPPYTGSFQPDQPLSGLDGISALGNWTFRVADEAGGDEGSIDSWTLQLTYPAAACGPHGIFSDHALVVDTCATGGAGNADGVWDAGEAVQLSVTLQNDGTVDLTNVTATVVPLTAGVSVSPDTATFPAIAIGDSATSNAPHYTAYLPESLTCGQEIAFEVHITADQGSWVDPGFTQVIGTVLSGGGTALAEDFTGGVPPTGWSIVDGSSDGWTWFADSASDPSGCSNTDPASPIAGTWAAVDSDCNSVDMNEELITPVINLSDATSVAIDFDHYYNKYGSESADLDVKSSLTGGAWVNVHAWTADTNNPTHETFDITTQAAGAADVQLRWHYYNANYEWYWYVDNVVVSFTAPGGCEMNTCVGGVASADLSITKTDGLTEVSPGQAVTYTIVVSNAGPDAVVDATVTDTFPADLTGASWTCVGSGGATCAGSGSGNIADLPDLPMGGSVTYTVNGSVSSGATGTLANTAAVAPPAGTSDPVPANNTATDTDTIVEQSADVWLKKMTAGCYYLPGSPITYTITVGNAGPADAMGATVVDTFPATLLSPTWTCSEAGGGSCPAASGSGNINGTVDLPTGTYVVFTVNATVAASATRAVVNTATVTGTGSDPVISNNSSSHLDALEIPIFCDSFETGTTAAWTSSLP